MTRTSEDDLYDLFPLDDLDLSGQTDSSDLYDLNDLAHIFLDWSRTTYTDPAQDLITAG